MIVTQGFREALATELGYRSPDAPAVEAISALVEAWIPRFFLACETIGLPCGHPTLKPERPVQVVDCACGRTWHLKAEAGRTWNAQELC